MRNLLNQDRDVICLFGGYAAAMRRTHRYVLLIAASAAIVGAGTT
jgi:hypothetical protein